MNERDRRDVLVAALCRQIDEFPLAIWFTVEELAELSPDIVFDEDGERCEVAGAEGFFTAEDIDDAEIEVQVYAEDKGLFVDWDYDRGISLHEYIDPTKEFDFDGIESMVLTYEPALRFGGQSETRYDGETLKVGPTMEGVSDFKGRSVVMDPDRKERLRSFIEEADVPSWDREYAPIGYRVFDGWGWSLLIRFKSGKVFASEGSNAWPATLGFFWEGLFDIVGLEVPDGGDRPEWVCELVGQDDEE